MVVINVTQEGQVIKVQPQGILVRVMRKGACGDNCSMCGACEGKYIDALVTCDQQVKVGNRVVIQSNDRAIMFGLLFLFILPIVLTLGTYLTCVYYFGNIIALIGMVVGLAISIAAICCLSKSKKYLAYVQPKVVKVL